LDKFLSYAREELQPASTSKSACQLTVKELRAEVIQATKDIEKGNTISHEKVFEEIDKLLTS